MDLPQQLFVLACLFGALALSAQLTVTYVTQLVSKLGVRTFAFGIILGLITTLPELSLGINAQIEGTGALAVGNLLGGIIIIFSLILGFNVLINRRVKTEGGGPTLYATAAVIALPIILGVDGLFSVSDAVLMIGSYVFLVYYLYTQSNTHRVPTSPALMQGQDASTAILLALLGILSVLFFSHWIVELSSNMFSAFAISPFVLGITVFALGTNLPEISIALASWKKKATELSLGHLVGSAFTNVLIIGLLALLKPIPIQTDTSFWITVLFLTLITFFFVRFYQSNKNLDYKEGIFLILLYVAFVGVQAFSGF